LCEFLFGAKGPSRGNICLVAEILIYLEHIYLSRLSRDIVPVRGTIATTRKGCPYDQAQFFSALDDMLAIHLRSVNGHIFGKLQCVTKAILTMSGSRGRSFKHRKESRMLRGK
jgi:hypothetical protein